MMINLDKFYKETPKERWLRRHEEDIQLNPDRHNPQKESYLKEELILCPLCVKEFNYIFDYATNKYYRN